MKFLWTTIHVKDLDESAAFYTDIVGLKVLRRFEARPGVEIAFLGTGAQGETKVELIAGERSGDESFAGNIAIGFEVESADAMMAFVKRKNIPVHSGPFESPNHKFFFVKDPSGLNVQFFEHRKP